jgi:hypothetical protein
MVGALSKQKHWSASGLKSMLRCMTLLHGFSLKELTLQMCLGFSLKELHRALSLDERQEILPQIAELFQYIITLDVALMI